MDVSTIAGPPRSSAEQILSYAAMFEGDFNVDWLAALTGCKATHLLTILEEQVQNGRLVSRGPGAYTHAHPEVRAQILAALSEAERQDRHRKIADLLMNELTEAEGNIHLLSHHLLQISNDLESCHCLVKAGDLHLRYYNNETAFQCYAKAIEDLYVLSGEEVDRLFAETAIKYSKLSTARHDTTLVLDTLYDALARARDLGIETLQVLLQMHIAKNEWLTARYAKALSSFEKGWRQAKALNDPKLLRTANTFSTFFHYWQGRFREAVENYEKSVPDVDKLPEGQFPALARITVGYCYAQIGQVTQGLGMLDAVRSMCLERGDLYLASYASGNMGAVLINLRRVDEALVYLRQSAKEAEAACNDWVRINIHIMIAFAHFLLGAKKRCVRYLKEFLEQSRKVRATVQPYPYLLALSLAMKEGKLPPVRGVSLDAEIQAKLRGQNLYGKAMGYRYRSYQEKIEGRPVEESIQSLDSAMAFAEQSGHATELARCKLDLARICLCQGEKDRAVRLAGEGAGLLRQYSESLVPDDLRSLVDQSPRTDDLFRDILKLAREVAAIRDYKDLVQHIISTVNRLTGAERGAIFLLDRSDGASKLQMRGSKNLTPTHIDHPNFVSSMELIEEVARTGEGRILESDPDEKDDFFSNENIRSRICVPMIRRNKVVGVLYHDNRLLSSAFRKPHLELLAFFAAIAAIALDNALANQEIRRLNRKLNQEKQYYQEEHIQCLNFKEIVGRSQAIQFVLGQIEQVADSDATVLITGETGVGKELVARAIHRLSRRQKRSFIRVHCSALPENLIPSELFGHEKGAFTGAAQRRIGRFELADGGTLFLDEMGEIAPDIQTSLLRVLQTKEFERVGGTETLRSDFRLIAATNRDLQHEVKVSRFRADLYYRLNVFPIHVPPLRERKEDIPLLVFHFVHIHARRTGKVFKGVAEEDMERLIRYDWPGNVRELENVVERACILSRENGLKIPDLETGCHTSDLPTGAVTLQEMEARHLRWALERANWKVRGPGGAAELLDVNPSTLRFRMKKHGIARPPSHRRPNAHPDAI
jgi:formate hydrogenlyase transcriptional activator